jgi:hypothetical protein
MYNKGFTPIIILIVAVLVVGGGALYLRYENQTTTQETPTPQPPITQAPTPVPNPMPTPTPTSQVQPKPQPTPTTSAGVSASIGNILDCGNPNSEASGPCLAKNTENFIKYLGSCTPAKGTVYIGYEVFYGFARNVEIVGKQNNACVLKFSLAKSPDPAYLGKEMTCRLDSSKDYYSQVGGLDKCTGPLADSLKGWKPPQ